MSTSLFRQSSLKKLSSPEQLDELIRVTGPRGWLSLVAALAVLASAGIWSYYGTIPEKVAGQGIMTEKVDLLSVTADGSGRVTELLVRPDEMVKAGQVVAKILQHDLLATIEQLESKLTELKLEDQLLDQLEAEAIALEEESVRTKRNSLEQTIRDAERHKRTMESWLAQQRELRALKIVAKTDVISAEKAIDEIVREINEANSQLAQLPVQLAQRKQAQRQENLSRQFRISEVSRELEDAQRKLERNSQVVSPFPGEVDEIRVAPGMHVQGGSVVMLLVPSRGPNADLEAVLYLDASQAKDVRPGMAVEVSPTTVKREEYGYIRGVVSRVADYPATEEGMMAVVDNRALVQTFIQQAGLPLEIYVELNADPQTISGYEWSSSQGPPTVETDDSICTGAVLVRKRRPITYVVPLLKKWLGLD